MSERIIVGINTGNKVSMFSRLGAGFDNIIIHEDPKVNTFDGYTNCDIMVYDNFNGYVTARGVPTYQNRGGNKVFQNNALRTIGVPTPQMFSVQCARKSLDAMSTNVENVVIKHIDGADGYGVALVPGFLAERFIYDIEDDPEIEVDELKLNYPMASISGYPTGKFLQGNTKTAYIFEYIPDIVSEYRVHVFYDEFYIYARPRHHASDHKDFRQANMSKGPLLNTEIIPILLNDENITDGINSKMLEYTKLICKELSLLVGCVDFYVCDNGSVGVMEYATAFGTTRLPAGYAYTNVKKAIYSMVSAITGDTFNSNVILTSNQAYNVTAVPPRHSS